MESSRQRWVAERRYLNANRYRLSGLAQGLYPDHPAVRGLLVADGWLPRAPVPLDEVAVVWSPSAAPAPVVERTGYAETLGTLAPPAVFEDRPCYRLTDVSTGDGGRPQLTFGRATYFDIVDVCEAVAHELAASRESLPLRTLVGDPCDLTRRPVVPAISVLTVRKSRRDGPTVLLHHRDSAKVVHAGGLYQVVPVGVFQPSSATAGNEANDFDLWRSVAREYAEELLGEPELAGDDGPLDYDGWPFYRELQSARRVGGLRVSWLGLGIDPLSLVADLLVVAVFDDEVFDALFARRVSTNAEGELLAVPFTQSSVERYAGQGPMQAAGAALLDLAWRHGVLEM